MINEIPAPWMNEGDGYENVTYEVNTPCFKLYRAYSISFSSKKFKKKKKIVTLRSLSSQNIK